MGLTSANKSPMMTPFHSSLPIDAIPHVEMTPEEQAPLKSKMQLDGYAQLAPTVYTTQPSNRFFFTGHPFALS